MPIEKPSPPPGSDKAVAQGCTCPVLDNAHGRGYLGDGERFGWVVVESCPLHGEEREEQHGDSAPVTPHAAENAMLNKKVDWIAKNVLTECPPIPPQYLPDCDNDDEGMHNCADCWRKFASKAMGNANEQ